MEKIGLRILLRAIILLLIVFGLTRLMGKRNMSKMTPFNFISYVVMAIVVTLMSLNYMINFTYGIITLLVWSLLPIAIDYLALKSKVAYSIINGKEKVLIKDGKVMEDNLGKSRLTGEDLIKALRAKNIFNLADVEFAVMETTGDIDVIPKADKKPITPHDLGEKVAPQTSPQTVILDGKIIHEGLTNMGLNEGWLQAQLQSQGVLLQNVFIGMTDSSGDLYLDLYDDKVQISVPPVKELLYANIEKTQADLMSFGLETENEESKNMYLRDAEELKKVMDKLKPFLLR